MSRVHDKDAERVRAPATESETESPGKVVVDSRGHSVWQWAKDVLENTSVLLKRLENKDLALESTQKVPVLPGQEPGEKGASPKATKRADSNAKAAKDAASKSAHFHPAIKPDQNKDRGGGFDPYNSR
jgi:hypothetical protein